MRRFSELSGSALATLDAAARWLAHPFLLMIRLYWGWQFFLSGKGKLMDLPRVTEFFTSLGLPQPGFQALLAGSVECFGGLLLVIGLLSRPVAVPLIITMVVAFITADREALTGMFSDPDSFLGAAPFLFLLASVIIFIFGPGALSVDALIRLIRRRRAAARAAANPTDAPASVSA